MSLLDRKLKEKDTPVNSDFFFISDSENSDAVKYILWSDIVTAIGTGGGLTQQQVEGLI